MPIACNLFISKDLNLELLALAVGGLCNLIAASQKLRVKLFHQREHHPCLVECLSASDPEVVVNGLTSIIYLFTPSVQIVGAQLTPARLREFQASICTDFQPLKDRVQSLLTEHKSSASDPRIAVLASIFISDCCGLAVD